ncbi:MAG: PDZ domain-containing protein [Vicinamibacteria bacterium]
MAAALGTLLLAGATGAAGQQMQMIKGDGGVLSLPGGGVAVVVVEGGAPVVRGVVRGSRAVDLLEGDRIVSLQDQPATTPAALQKSYDALEEGADVVLGVVRGGTERQVRFPRPPHETGEKHVVMGGDGGAGAWTSARPGAHTAQEVVIAGARIRNNEQGMPEVVLRGSDPAAARVPLRVGDVVLSVNGRGLSALAGLEMLYGRVAVGDEVTLTILRDGAEQTLRFSKPAGR